MMMHKGALDQIDWSKSNRVSINVNNRKSHKQQSQDPHQQQAQGHHQQPSHSQQRPPSSHGPAYAKNPAPAVPASKAQAQGRAHGKTEEEIPINRYQSVVAPVKSGKEEVKAVPKSRADNGHRVAGGSRYHGNTRGSEDDSDEDGSPVYLGYLGSIKVPADSISTGITAIQAPMRNLYFPYRDQKTVAQERVINVKPTRLEIYYIPDPDADEPETLAIDWQDILYVEPLRFTSKKPGKDMKNVRAAFEPCEAQRVALLGNRDSLYTPLNKQHKHITLLKHPALLCMVVKSPQNPNEIFTHGYICSTVEEAVFLARQIRDELEIQYRESDHTETSTRSQSLDYLSVSRLSLNSVGYQLDKHSNQGSQSKLKSKKSSKKKEKGMYSTHTGNDTEDLGSFHFGLSPSEEHSGRITTTQPKYYNEEIEDSFNENFLIGKNGLQHDIRQSRPNSMFSDMDSNSVGGNSIRKTSDNRPVGVVQPQIAGTFKDGFRVLPTDVGGDKSKLKPTVLNIKAKKYSDVTPELDLKLRMRQQEEDSEPMLSSLVPRSVVNPLVDAGESRKSFLTSFTPGPIGKMNTASAFNPATAFPQTGWHESVIGNYKSKEKIEKKMTTETVDPKELGQLKKEKKELEMANLFSDVDPDTVAAHEGEDNFTLGTSDTLSKLHDAMGFLP